MILVEIAVEKIRSATNDFAHPQAGQNRMAGANPLRFAFNAGKRPRKNG
jgi:hypothetical protein